MKILHLAAIISFLSLIAATPSKKSKVNSPLFSNYQPIPKGEVFLDVKPREVEEFYISTTEISNGQYQTFLNYLKLQNRIQDLNAAMLDTGQWKKVIPYSEPYVNYYHSHKAFEKYPCVNMSFEGATLYCAWLKEMLELADNRYDYEVSLPNKNQWIYAASGGKKNSPYSWSGPYMKNKYGVLCNFRDIGANSIHFDEATEKYVVVLNQGFDIEQSPKINNDADVTAPVLSYMPNGYGLYNVCGNVAEMIAEKGIAMGGSFYSTGYDVRVRSEIKYTNPLPTVGFRPIIVLKEK